MPFSVISFLWPIVYENDAYKISDFLEIGTSDFSVFSRGKFQNLERIVSQALDNE